MNKKKTGISGVLADFGSFFFRTSWLPILLKILKILKFFDFSKGVKMKDWTENRENQSSIYFKDILSIGIKFS